MSHANRLGTAITPADQTKTERIDKSAGTAPQTTNSRGLADDHAGEARSLQDISFRTGSVTGDMTGQTVEAEGRPPYAHVRTSFPLSVRPCGVAVALQNMD